MLFHIGVVDPILNYEREYRQYYSLVNLIVNNITNMKMSANRMTPLMIPLSSTSVVNPKTIYNPSTKTIAIISTATNENLLLADI